jgi:predicted lipoprotein with Yx(FWY)xxD motif
MSLKSAAALTLIAIAATTAQAQPILQDGVLTDTAGRTLYTFDKDQPNKSNCQGGCAQAWPAYVAEPAAGAKPASQASRFDRDGAQQWAWNGSPLYYYAGDTKPGDRTGDGKGGVWHVVKPAAASNSSAGTSSGYAY